MHYIMHSFKDRQIEYWWNRIFIHTYYASKTSGWNPEECWEAWVVLLDEAPIHSLSLQWHNTKTIPIKGLILHNQDNILSHPFFKNCVRIIYQQECTIYSLMHISFISALYVANYYGRYEQHRDTFLKLNMDKFSTFYQIQE